MYSAVLRQDAIPEITQYQRHAKDTFFLCDVGGLVQEAQNTPMVDWRYLEAGKPELTKLADKYMSEFEDDVFTGHVWKNVDDVVGALPNIPSFLAGHPQCMRRKTRGRGVQSPLIVMFELTGSAGTMDQDSRARRGAAMLALVKLLNNTRPVEFWTLTTYGCRNEMCMVACKMETNPLDIARSAAALCDNHTVQLLTEVNKAIARRHGRGCSGTWGWSYGVPELERRWSGEALRRVLEPSAETLFIPACYVSDLFREPKKWVRDMLKKYGMGATQDEYA